MKLRLLFSFAVMLFLSSGIYAQKPKTYDVRVYSEQRDDDSGTYDIYAEVYQYGTYTVILRFNNFENAKGRGIEYAASASSASRGAEYKKSIIGHERILTLTPIDPTRTWSWNYSYSYRRGKLDPRVDEEFIYRLPYGAGKSIRASDLYNLRSRHFGEEEKENWKSIRFSMSEGDTVYAARKGVVVDIVNEYDPVETPGRVGYSENSNELLIEHADGTLASYDVLKRDSFMVKKGDTVYPDTPLALVGSYEGNAYQLRFNVYYLITLKETKDIDKVTGQLDYAYVNPVFETAEGRVRLEHDKNYTSVVSDELITREMSRREVNRSSKK